MKLDTKIPCQVCGRKTDRIAAHVKCLDVAFALITLDDDDAVYDPISVKAVIDDCYLCGEPIGNTEAHADHVYPKSAGGSNHWSNIGVAHSTCNLKKQAQIGIADDQRQRLEAQHEKLRQIAARLDAGIWYQSIVAWIGDDLGDPDELDWLIKDYLEDFTEDYPEPPKAVIARFRELTENPDAPRFTQSEQRLGMVLDALRAAYAAEEAEWEAKYGHLEPEEALAEILATTDFGKMLVETDQRRGGTYIRDFIQRFRRA